MRDSLQNYSPIIATCSGLNDVATPGQSVLFSMWPKTFLASPQWTEIKHSFGIDLAGNPIPCFGASRSRFSGTTEAVTGDSYRRGSVFVFFGSLVHFGCAFEDPKAVRRLYTVNSLL